MAVLIQSVAKKSPADKKGVRPGETLVSINGHEINDVLDYQFYAQEKKLVLALLSPQGRGRAVTVRKDAMADLGLEFETYLMDSQRRCKNKCVFCFIDQMPPGMRETLYFKDDDARLSFLFGNYVTLTNLSERDVARIIEMHISPVNVSVHTMNPALRVEMMKNPHAGESLQILYRLAEAGIALNTQLVLCPGINDGPELEHSLTALEALLPALQSVATVPVGLTKYREHLPLLREYTKETARQVIDIVDGFGDRCLARYGRRVAFCADEFYLKAELPLPDEAYYEDYPQIENGVGMWKSMETEFCDALDVCDLPPETGISVDMATGMAAKPLLESFARAVRDRFPGAKIAVHAIRNDFFGHSITVAGLVTGRDLIAQLKGKDLHGRLLIPSVMLRSEGDCFLDDVTLHDVEAALGVPVSVCENNGSSLLEKILHP
ncbi:MAG: DUF512 domain-containing protein [Clostridia bacterium]|nr:DUF512 domain-containing protein [Clostridia bacterium]